MNRQDQKATKSDTQAESTIAEETLIEQSTLECSEEAEPERLRLALKNAVLKESLRSWVRDTFL